MKRSGRNIMGRCSGGSRAWAVRCGLALVVVGLAVKLGLPGLLK